MTIFVPALCGALALPALLLLIYGVLRLLVPYWERARDAAPVSLAPLRPDDAEHRALMAAITAGTMRSGRVLALGNTAVVVVRGRVAGGDAEQIRQAVSAALRPSIDPITVVARPRRREDAPRD